MIYTYMLFGEQGGNRHKNKKVSSYFPVHYYLFKVQRQKAGVLQKKKHISQPLSFIQSKYRTGFDLDGYFSSSFFFGVAGGFVSGFPPVFLMVAERVRVAMADGRGRGRSPVGLGWTMGI